MLRHTKGAGRPITASSPWKELAENIGGIGKLAEKLGVTRSTLNKWKLGVHRIPTLARKEVLRLCKYYGIKNGVDSL